MGEFHHVWWAGLIIAIMLVAVVYTADILKGDEIPDDLTSVEVREYEGSVLSSIDEFRENSIRGPQVVNLSEYRLTIGGMVRSPREYTYEEIINQFPHYRKVVTIYCVEGWDITILWEGIRVRDLIEEAHPADEATTVIFRATDGYSTSLPLEYLVRNNILIASRMNNVTLPPERGFPFQLVAEEKWGYKWIKWIISMELTNDQNYQGFWERRGYANNGSIDRGFFD